MVFSNYTYSNCKRILDLYVRFRESTIYTNVYAVRITIVIIGDQLPR